MTRYKVGDTVRVREDLVTGEYYRMEGDDGDHIFFAKGMEKYIGKYVTINDVIDLGRNMSSYHIVEAGWAWTDEMFDDISDDDTGISFDLDELFGK